MNPRLLALVLVLAGAQDDPGKAARELIESFRSSDLETRETATQKLKALGPAAKTELEKFLKDGDAAVARLATILIQRLDLQGSLPKRLQEALPGVADRLASGGDPAWTEAFLAVALKCESEGRLPILTRREIEPLLSRAVRGAATEEAKSLVARAINTRRLYAPPLDLLPLLEDPQLGFRPSIVEAVNRNPPEAIVRRLIEGTRDPEPFIRSRAITDLGVLRIERAIPDAIRLLKDGDKKVRAQSVEALAEMLAKEKAPEIAALLKDGETQVRFAALEALDALYAREAIPAVEERLEDEGEGIRREAVTTLADLDARESIPKILPLLKDPDEEVRRVAVYALRNLVAREAIPNVKPLLSDPEDSVRNAAFYFLDEMDLNRAGERLKDPDSSVRSAAATRLGKQGRPEDVAALVEALKDKEDWVCEEAAIALTKLGDRRGLDTLNRLFKAGLPDQEEIIRALADLGSKEIIPKAIALLGDKSAGTRSTALRSLKAVDAKEAAAKVESLLEDSDALVQIQAVSTLAALAGRGSLPRILRLLRDKSSSTLHVWAALSALAQLNAWEQEPEVALMLEDLEPRVRYHAATWLVRMGSTKGVLELLDQDVGPQTALNALREPEVWKRLDGIKGAADIRGSRLQRIEKLAQMAGMKVVLVPDPLGDARRRFGREPGIAFYDSGDSVLFALSTLVALTHTVVLDKDQIRIMDLAAGERFWRAWWKERQSAPK